MCAGIEVYMKLEKLSCVIAILLGLSGIMAAESPGKNNVQRIGIYDSRAVAVAFAGSDAHKKSMAPLAEEHKKAKAAGDAKRVKELEAQGKAGQEKMHAQGFSTAPVDDILEYIKDQLPAIRKEAGVTELVSKWDEKALARHKSAEQVDVTEKLVDAFKPSAKQRKTAMEIQKQKPIPISQLKAHD